MNRKLTPIASAVTVLILSTSMSAQAQQTAAPAAADQPTSEVVVTGIRASKQKSLEVKRNADVIEEVVSAEDIGKMPDKNVADAVERLPGVQVQNGASGTGGAFDEPDRVSIRSTSPSLTNTTINGHSVSSGDWFVLDQTGLAGRSISFDLLPSEIVSRVVVHKDQVASDQEGGAMGNVDIETRKPLDFKNDFTGEASLGAAYSDLAGKTDPQFNGLVSWKNAEHTFGAMLQLFDEDRHLRRDGVEELTYLQVPNTGAYAGTPLAGVYYPEVISSALFQQERKRAGGELDLQFKPSNDAEIDVNGFFSHMDANNENSGYMLNMGATGLISQGLVPSSYSIKNGTLVSATWLPTATSYGAYDETYSRIATATSGYLNIDGKFRLNSATTLKTQIGYTDGKGTTEAQNMFAGQYVGSAGSYQLNGMSTPTDSVTVNPSSFNGQGLQLNWLWGANPSVAEDKEAYGKIDFITQTDFDTLPEVKYGARFSHHDRSQLWIGQGPTDFAAADTTAAFNVAASGVSTYPSNFGSGLGSGFINNAWLLSPAGLAAYDGAYATRNPASSGSTGRFYPGGSYDVQEDDTAAYIEGKLAGNGWSGNIGVRAVLTAEKLRIPQSVTANTPGAQSDAFGYWITPEVDHDFIDILPSTNFRFDLTKDVDLRVAASRTMSRVDYGALGSPVSINQDPNPGQPNAVGYAAGGNPNLKPVRSNNLDAEIEWYFKPRSYFSVGLFESDLVSYVGQGTSTQSLENATYTQKTGTPVYSQYLVTSPVNTTGNVMGVELGYEQDLGHGFGINANFTYADAQQTGDACVVPKSITSTSTSPCDLIGSSRITYNLGGFYEDAHWSARVAYTYRDDYFNGLTTFGGPSYTEGYGTLAASVGYTFNDHYAIHLDMMNLNDPIERYYAYNKDQPLAAYDNGRQYYLTFNAKF